MSSNDEFSTYEIAVILVEALREQDTGTLLYGDYEAEDENINILVDGNVDFIALAESVRNALKTRRR